ncbi:EAL domain, c-di-GMP-specific phosphodiesterase class I (or its enzymatically inactive variant) [Ruminococcus flavefaciens]|uniref:EAL domain, c-di-GMP-specific phosphodiesterase class I (Or its enzymatically inactive variant) n=1 Tax=Ruminococcus flavefaciens TaxID=1265 RepID=A0A1H6HPZ1_RUMFL|nr:bifunctional diguanylate cyclase/phosphodiesterase [Ruminococcus flavefaciens]SEH37142.1 EAL domain, c-di-GMP-specific phosphodiesterase class I (or its enzymatically inactive variant) [Ruminococcus flavefaciens]
MGNEELLEYYRLFDALLYTMTDVESFDIEEIKNALADLCKFFKISKGITEFYQNISNEKANKGDVFVGYDNGEDCVEIISRRIVTKSMAVVKCSAYRSEKIPPLSADDVQRVDLVMRTVLSFISRNRLQNVVEKFTFYDEYGYRNVRSFIRYIENLDEKGILSGHTAIYYNLRHFTLINREIGRNNGDIAMRNFFNMIENIVGDNGIVCRVGGDNFVSVFKDELLDDILKIVKGVPVVYDNNNQKRIMVSASTGVFRITDEFVYETPGDIMDRILSSSQAAKIGGKDSIVFFDDKMEIGKEKRMKIQQLFPIALKNKEFKVFYQPKIDIQTGELVGAEALCRWFKEGKIIPPMEFIPVLEYSTDICQLDFYMLDNVCKDIRRWLDEGHKVVRVSVNLSRKHMMDVDLLDHIIEIVDRNNVPHNYIEIELTETTTDVEFRDLKRVVSGLQQAGICTSVDDFGMGYSSLNLIREVPWNVLKVDRSFLPLDEENSQSTRNVMFKYVVGMAKELGLECVAEGVETKRQVEILKNNQCVFAQGYYFDRPLPLDEFEDRLIKHHYIIDSGVPD